MHSSSRNTGSMMNVQFLFTFILRILSLVVQTVLPLYLSSTLHLPSYTVGLMISLLWIGNALGAITGALLFRGWRKGGLTGLLLLAASFSGYFAFSSYHLLSLFIMAGGFGSGLIQPLLAPSMHSNSRPSSPFRGISLYSTALSLALVLGPLISSIVIGLSSFKMLFIMLSAICLISLSLPLMASNNEDGSEKKGLLTGLIQVFSRTLLLRDFRREFLMNLVYSLTLPIILSFAGIVAEKVYNFSSTDVLLSLTALFAISSTIRFSMRNTGIKKFSKVMLLPASLLLVSSIILYFGNSWFLFLAGLLLFSVPHATIYPWTLYNVFQTVDRERLVQASYIFSLSSGISEFISPPLTSFAIYYLGIAQGIGIMVPFSIIALFIALTMYR
ncbi:MAG: MFS transporter [Conexivisphaerales archaeon]